MTAPPVNAGSLSVTVPVVGSPPIIVAGERVFEISEGTSSVSVADCDDVAIVAVIVAVVVNVTSEVVTVKVAEVAP